jgi:hypothetical protein
MVNPLSLSSAVRALGAAGAVALPTQASYRRSLQAALLGTTDAAAHRIDPKGITVVSVTPEAGRTFTPAQRLACDALSSVGWAGLGLLVVVGVEHLPVSRAARVLGLGVSIYALDRVSAHLMERLLAIADRARVTSDSATSQAAAPEEEPAVMNPSQA